MQVAISPSFVSGKIIAPASKSAMQRACALALLNNGNSIIQNPGKSNDDLTAIEIIKKLGAQVNNGQDAIHIYSSGKICSSDFSCGESGLSLRMFAPIASLSTGEICITGEGSLLKRPIGFFDTFFPELGIDTNTNKGFLPLMIKGPLRPGNITIDGSTSSQYLTGLLFAFAKAASAPLIIQVDNLKSKPYVELSIQMLKHFGYFVTHNNYRSFFISPVILPEQQIIYKTEGDWSAASFLLVAGAIAGNVHVNGIDIKSAQADVAITNALIAAGAKIAINDNAVFVNNSNELKAFTFDATDCPDLFPPLVALATHCKGTSVIKGISRLAGKESDRAKTLFEVFSHLEQDITLQNDNMIINGGKGIKGARVSSHHDHRIAMSCAVAALKAEGTTLIDDADSVNKSYPDFFRDLQTLGVQVICR